ncbi:hypothetical protein K7432_002610 [Basidiobolus ranarum]|uniref:Uncharacterized protein n=1 Tax=Basidiobolus ranarum TaxID=34480 RepID=A0ABR2W7G7_9FUNG
MKRFNFGLLIVALSTLTERSLGSGVEPRANDMPGVYQNPSVSGFQWPAGQRFMVGNGASNPFFQTSNTAPKSPVLLVPGITKPNMPPSVPNAPKLPVIAPASPVQLNNQDKLIAPQPLPIPKDVIVEKPVNHPPLPEPVNRPELVNSQVILTVLPTPDSPLPKQSESSPQESVQNTVPPASQTPAAATNSAQTSPAQTHAASNRKATSGTSTHKSTTQTTSNSKASSTTRSTTTRSPTPTAEANWALDKIDPNKSLVLFTLLVFTNWVRV